jgi:two-component system response regulator FlrC
MKEETRMSATVMVVDDEPVIRKSLARAIQRTGVDVVTAADGPEALAKFREVRSSLVFADACLPGMDGFALMRSLKHVAPETAVVLITGFDVAEIAAQARQEGARAVLAKPFTYESVRTLLAEALPGATDGSDLLPLTESPEMESVLGLGRRVAATDATVLILGETGTGKEVLARYIHRASGRATGPFVAVNCSALPESLAESELFGHERGAFTGAIGRRAGLFEAASGGTLVLDEVSEIPLTLQAKLLRVLQEKEVIRVGTTTAVPIDVRVIAVSNRDLRTEVREGRFRPDLFYRLNVVCLRVPPLRERAADIPLLTRYFLQRYGAAHGSRATGFTAAGLDWLLSHRWPGNVRELENVVQRAVIMTPEGEIGPEHLTLESTGMEVAAPVTPGRTIADVERELILATLGRLNGNRTSTAKALGISVRTIRNRLREYRNLQVGAGVRA